MFRELMLSIMIVFQVLSNFDPVKEIPKMRYQIYVEEPDYAGEKTPNNKSSAPQFFNHFNLSLNR